MPLAAGHGGLYIVAPLVGAAEEDVNDDEEAAIADVKEDDIPCVEADVVPDSEEDVIPGAEEDVIPDAEEDVMPGVEEDVIPDAEEEMSGLEVIMPGVLVEPVIITLEEAIDELDTIAELEETGLACEEDDRVDVRILWLDDTTEELELIVWVDDTGVELKLIILLTTVFIAAVLDTIVVVLELVPLHVPNIGSQFPGAQYWSELPQ